MDGYIRVSRRRGREGPGYISPDVQREAIQRWADYRGIEIVAWHDDEDESGGTQQRPGLREAMARVEAGETDGIACWRLNRFARNVMGAIEDVKRVQAAGGVLAFVEEDIDPTGPFGEFILTILLAVATLERENIVAGWKTATTRATKRGAKIGPTPYGYRRGKDGILEPDPVQAPIVTEAFRLAAQEGFEAGLAYVLEHGKGHRWTATTFRRLLRARSYLGEVIYGDLVKTDAHPALVSEAIWAAAQPDVEAPRRPRAMFPLSGLAHCAACGSPMVGSRAGRHNQRVYRCSMEARSRKTVRCSAPAFATASLLEDLVRRTVAYAVRRRAFAGGDDPAGALDAAKEALDAATAELDDLVADIELRRSLGAERFRHLADSAVADVEAKQREFEEAARQVERRLIVQAPELVETAELDELGELLRGTLDSVIVERGRSPLVGRVRIVPKGDPAETWVPPAEDAQSSRVETG